MATADFTSERDVWEMEASSGGGGDFELCPAGNHPALIAAVIDLGTHRESVTNTRKDPVTGEEREYLEDKDLRKIALVYELAKKQTNGKPFVMADEFNWSMHTTSKFYKRVTSFIGHTFNDGERFDPRGILGLPCMVNVAHKPGKSQSGESRTYANVTAVTQFPEGFPPPTPTLEHFVYSPRSGEPFVDRDWLPRIYGKEIKSTIDNCQEVRHRNVASGQRVAPAAPSQPPTQFAPPPKQTDDPQDTPF